MILVIPRVRQRQQAANPHFSLLTDPALVVLLYRGDPNIEELQRNLEALAKYNISFATSVLFFASRICTIQDYDLLLSTIRIALEIFILYSICTSDYEWLIRVPNLSEDVERLSTIKYQWSYLPQLVDRPLSIQYCLRVSERLKLVSRFEECRAGIIETIAQL